MSPDDLKREAAAMAVTYVQPGMRLGLGTGSTAKHFVDLLAERVRGGLKIVGVPTSEATRAQAQSLGVPLTTLDETPELDLTVDGADEFDPGLRLIKGGGGALTREKIVAAQSRQFVCIADESKLVKTLGAFPLPVEVIPMATARVMRQFAALGGVAQIRQKDGHPRVTDNGQYIVDVSGLHITDPLAFETQVSQWPGVVTVGVFAHQKAHVCLLGTASGVKTLTF